MANVLTGEFDVVAEFAIPAVNRVLAAMHSTERFPHSLAIKVDDNPPPGSQVTRPSIVSSVDMFGDATVDHSRLGTVVPLAGASAAAARISSALDPVVNPDLVVSTQGTVVPSHLQGRAQLQLSPPTIELSDASGKNFTVNLDVMARYFPDPHTSPLAEFMRGQLQLTAGVDQVVSQQLNMIDVNIKADAVNINFSQAYPPQALSAEDSAALILLIRNALKTGFLPSSNPVPGNIDYVQFKALVGSPNAIAALLNLASFENGRHIIPEEGSGNPASMNKNFLDPADHFAFAVGIDYLRPKLTEMLNQPIPPIPVHHWLWGSTTYTVSLTGVSVDFPGKIVVTITGSATQTKRRFPNFNFTAQLDFTLIPTGKTADLRPGDVSVDTDSWWVNNVAKDQVVNGIRDARNAALSQKDLSGLDAYDKVNSMVSIDQNLGQFLDSLLKPPDQKPGVPQLPDLQPVLAYTSVGYWPSGGVVLHGAWLTVPDPPGAHVEFEKIPAAPHGPGGLVGGGLFAGPDYSALNSWIPGGTIQRYEWASQGQAQPYIDENKFVLISSPPLAVAGMAAARVGPGFVPPGVATTGEVTGYTPMCLTVRGSRLSASGQVVQQPIASTTCGYSVFPLGGGIKVAPGGALAMVALTQPGPDGLVQVAGHTAAQLDGAGSGTPNRIVHFADDKTSASLDFLVQALRDSGRTDAATAVLAVLTPAQLAKARYTQGVIYSEDPGPWEQAFGVNATRRPLTLIAAPKGNVVWQQEGQLDSRTLAEALRKTLVAGGSVKRDILSLKLGIGRQTPNFLFELASGRQMTLRKLARRSRILIFWKSSLQPSLEALRSLDQAAGKPDGQGPVVLAINDGEDPALAKRVASENKFSATIVTDPARNISLAYGVNIWPTFVFLDEFGLVTEIRYGRLAGDSMSPSPPKAAAR